MRAQRLDWPGLLRAGLGGLRLTPDQFWRLTPAEMAMMMGDPGAVRPLGRAQLDLSGGMAGSGKGKGRWRKIGHQAAMGSTALRRRLRHWNNRWAVRRLWPRHLTAN